jgi:hypothetical protein
MYYIINYYFRRSKHASKFKSNDTHEIIQNSYYYSIIYRTESIIQNNI